MDQYLKRIEEMKKKNPFIMQTEIAYNILSEDIVQFVLKPKDKVNQDSIATKLHMSRTPVREAIAMLEDEGLIVNTGKGYQVYDINIKDFIDFYEYRIVLEAKAAYLAARFMSDSKISELKKCLEEFIKYSKIKDAEMSGYYDEKFHNLIIEGSGNEYIIKSIKKFNLKQKYFFQRLSKNSSTYSVAIKKHTDIYLAIKERDENKAQESMQSHLSFYIHKIDKF